jgi:hypothetical protein
LEKAVPELVDTSVLPENAALVGLVEEGHQAQRRLTLGNKQQARRAELAPGGAVDPDQVATASTNWPIHSKAST